MEVLILAKKTKKAINKTIIVAVVAAAIFLFVGFLFVVSPSLTGNVILCPIGDYTASIHVDGNRDGYISPINKARIRFRSKNTNCVYEGTTDVNGDINIRVIPGPYKISVEKTGKCYTHQEDITVITSDLFKFRLKDCKRNFNI